MNDVEELPENDEDVRTCPACETEQHRSDCLLGTRGGLAQFQCRFCGWEWIEGGDH
jgi:transcription elongation factor Elf1